MAQVPSHVDTSAPGRRLPPRGLLGMISRTQGRWMARLALGRRPDPNPAQTPHLHVSHSAAQVGPVAVRSPGLDGHQGLAVGDDRKAPQASGRDRHRRRVPRRLGVCGEVPAARLDDLSLRPGDQ